MRIDCDLSVWTPSKRRAYAIFSCFDGSVFVPRIAAGDQDGRGRQSRKCFSVNSRATCHPASGSRCGVRRWTTLWGLAMMLVVRHLCSKVGMCERCKVNIFFIVSFLNRGFLGDVLWPASLATVDGKRDLLGLYLGTASMGPAYVAAESLNASLPLFRRPLLESRTTCS
jgi:hypothetical protein